MSCFHQEKSRDFSKLLHREKKSTSFLRGVTNKRAHGRFAAEYVYIHIHVPFTLRNERWWKEEKAGKWEKRCTQCERIVNKELH